jgi:hypothetical protein
MREGEAWTTAQLPRGLGRVSSIDALLAREELASYHLAHSVRADLCRTLGRVAVARDSYEKALALFCASQIVGSSQASEGVAIKIVFAVDFACARRL